MQQKITTTKQVNFDFTLWRYQAFGEDAANYFDGKIFRKAIHLKGNLYLISLFVNSTDIFLDTDPPPKSENQRIQLIDIARHILGLQFPLHDFYDYVQSDPVLSELTSKFKGLRPTLTHNLFEALVTSITAQQINLRFAFSVRSRIVKKYGESIQFQGSKYYAFPTPDRLSKVKAESLKKLQLTTKKSEYIIGISQAIADGTLDLNILPQLPDQEIYDILLPIRGIGRWTVDWLQARGLGRGNAAPVGDLGVRKAIQKFYFNNEKKSEEELREFTKQWGDFSNLAIHYLLKGLAIGM